MDKTFELNNPVTFLELFKVLDAYPEKLNDHVSIKVGDEYFELKNICVASEDSNDVLDDGHLYLVVNGD